MTHFRWPTLCSAAVLSIFVTDLCTLRKKVNIWLRDYYYPSFACSSYFLELIDDVNSRAGAGGGGEVMLENSGGDVRRASSNPSPISDQNNIKKVVFPKQNLTQFQSIPNFRPKAVQNHTLWCSTYLYSTPPPALIGLHKILWVDVDLTHHFV